MLNKTLAFERYRENRVTAEQHQPQSQRELMHGLGWRLLGSPPSRFLVRYVCAIMAQRLEKNRGQPTLESRRGIVRLWRIERYKHACLNRDAGSWLLADGALLSLEDAVLELHISGDRLIEILHNRLPWKQAVAEDFASLVPLLETRTEVAIVGSTILQRQAAAFGASLRAVPPSFYSRMDTFYRKLILLAFHPGGFRRALAQNESLADAAISRAAFCRRFRSGSETGTARAQA